MEVLFKKTFFKDLKKLPKDIKETFEELVFKEIPNIKFSEIKNLKKIKGYDNFYRIKDGDYRVGFEYRNKRIVFYRALHRKDIYKYFP